MLKRTIAVIMAILMCICNFQYMAAADNSAVLIKETAMADESIQFIASQVYEFENEADKLTYLYALYRNGDAGGVYVYDVTDITEIKKINDIAIPFTHVDSWCPIYIEDSYLYIGAGRQGKGDENGKIYKYSLNNPADPSYIATYNTALWGGVSHIAVNGGFIYGAQHNNTGVQRHDDSYVTENADETVINMISPVLRNVTCPALNFCGDYIYVFEMKQYDQTNVRIDIRHKDDMSLKQTTGAKYKGIVIDNTDGHMYLIKDGKLVVTDVSEGYSKLLAEEYISETEIAGISNNKKNMHIKGDKLYISPVHTNQEPIYIFDIINPSEPVLMAQTEAVESKYLSADSRGNMYTVDRTAGKVKVFCVKDYKFSVITENYVTEVPFNIEGTLLDGADLRLSLACADFEKTYMLQPDFENEKWTAELSDIYDGNYTLIAEIYEDDEVVFRNEYSVTVDLEQYTLLENTNIVTNEHDADSVTVSVPSVNYENDTLSISGKIPMKTRIGFKEVNFVVNNPVAEGIAGADGSKIIDIKQKSLGNYNFSEVIENPIVNQDYTYKIICEGEEPIEGTFKYYGTAFINEAVSAINSATEENIGALLFEGITENSVTKGPYSDALGINGEENSDYASINNKTAVLKKLIKKAFDNESQIKEAFDSAVAEQKAKESLIKEIGEYTEIEDVKTKIEENSELLGIDLTQANSPYNDMDDEEKNLLWQSVIDAEVLTEDILLTIFGEENCILTFINTRAASEMMEALKKYSEELSLNEALLKKYTDKLSEKLISDVNKALARIEEDEYFKTIAEIKELFESSVEKAYKTLQSNNNSSSGGGSSSKGKGKSSIGGGISISKNQGEEKSEVEEKKIFIDLDNYQWAEESILYLYDKGVVQGKETGKFYPADFLTREEFVKMLVEATGMPVIESNSIFDDVESNSWYEKYVVTAYENGIILGIDERCFGTGTFITREQMAVMLDRFAKYMNIELKNGKTVEYTDEISDYAYESVVRLSQSGIISGMGNGIFAAKENANRAMGAKVLYELMKIMEEEVK